MPTRTIRISEENIQFLKSIDADINNAILILKQEKRLKNYFEASLKRMEEKINMAVPEIWRNR